MSTAMPKPAVARVWPGRTPAAIADTHADYMYEHGIKKIRGTEGNLAVQVLRRIEGDVAWFTTISYWGSRDEIKAYAGEDIEKPHHLPKDPEYLLELPEKVRHWQDVEKDHPWPFSTRFGAARVRASLRPTTLRVAGRCAPSLGRLAGRSSTGLLEVLVNEWST